MTDVGEPVGISWVLLPRALQPGPVPFRNEGRKTSYCNMFAPDMVFPLWECVRVSVFPYYYSRFAFKTATKKVEYWSLWLPVLRTPTSPVLAGWKAPDGGRIVCGFVSSAV